MIECDCGQPATLKDGSGWHCLACDIWVHEVQAALDRFIRLQRAETDMEYHASETVEPKARRDRSAYQRAYARRNRARIAIYQKTYHREWARKNLMRPTCQP